MTTTAPFKVTQGHRLWYRSKVRIFVSVRQIAALFESQLNGSLFHTYTHARTCMR